MPILDVRDIRKTFGKIEVLKGISFLLEEGEVLSIIGSSGSGRCLNFLERPDAGKGCILGWCSSRSPFAGRKELCENANTRC
ncbi:MAG: hypothetical protein IJS39_06350 [Synergistaceae bacterium]|nr:hypothetical protein [Synergistaceae bacterium]